MATENDFFDEQTEQSEVKTEIVVKHFQARAKVIVGHQINRGI